MSVLNVLLKDGVIPVGDGPIVQWQNGLPVNQLGELVVSANLPTHFHGILPFDDAGCVCVANAAPVVRDDGLPFTADRRIAITDSNAVTTACGTPYSSNGAIVASYASVTPEPPEPPVDDSVFQAEPGFTVTGDLTDGGRFTIAGSGLGQMQGDALQYVRGDERSNGQPVNGAEAAISPVVTFVIGIGADVQGHHLTFSNQRVRPGRKMSMRRVHASNLDGAYRAGGFGWNGQTRGPLIYFTYYRYFTGLPAPDSTADNLKQIYCYGNGVSPKDATDCPPAAILIPANTTSPWKISNNTNYGAGDPDVSTGLNLSSTSNAWQRWEFIFKLNSSGSATDGRAACWLNGVLRVDKTNHRWFGTGWKTNPTKWRQLRLGYMDKDYPEAISDFSDAYCADTLCRVEVGESSVWTDCRKRELQLTRASGWTDTRISDIVCNQGGFDTLAGNYLHLIAPDGLSSRLVGRWKSPSKKLHGHERRAWFDRLFGKDR